MPDQRDRSQIRSSLLKKGFIEFTRGRDHDYYFLYVAGQKTSIYTKLSRGSDYKTYNITLLDLVKRQLKLNTNQLLSLIDCNLDYDNYLKILKTKGINFS